MEAQLNVNYTYLEYQHKQLTIQNQNNNQVSRITSPNSERSLPAEALRLSEYPSSTQEINPQNALYVVYEEVSLKMEQLSVDLKVNEASPTRPLIGDYSPEAVSDRIVAFIAGLYEIYKEMHGESEEGLEDFFSQVMEGIERGFAEAREILEGYGMLTDETNDTIQETYDLTIEKVNALYEQLFESLNQATEELTEEAA